MNVRLGWLVALTLSSAQASTLDYSKAKIDWKQVSGQTLVLGGLQHPWMAAVQPLLPEFTKLTGITVIPQVASESEFVSKMPVTLAGGSAVPDVYMVWAFGQAVQAGWLEPLDSYLSNPKLTDRTWYDEKDIFTSAKQFPIWPQDKKQYALAITGEAKTLFIDKALLASKKLSPPKTFDDLYNLTTVLKSQSTAGIAMRAKPSGDAVPWTAAGFIFSYGGEIIDKNGRAAFDSPRAVAAIEMYAKLLRDNGPKGIASYHWYESLNDYMQGKAAVVIDSSNFALDIENPEKSRLAGKTLYGVFPSAPGGQAKPNMWHWMIGMNAKSQHKTAAWLFMEWATSQPTGLELARNRATPPRTSAWQDPGFRKIYGAQAADAALTNLRNADASAMTRAWYNPKSPQVLDVLAIAINQVITGQRGAQEALRDAAKKANDILK